MNENTKAARTAAMQRAIECSEAEATTKVDQLEGLDEVAFNDHVAFLAASHQSLKALKAGADSTTKQTPAEDDTEKARASVVAWMSDVFDLPEDVEQGEDEVDDGGW